LMAKLLWQAVILPGMNWEIGAIFVRFLSTLRLPEAVVVNRVVVDCRP